ncbi:hypothetical protein EBY67_08175 [bacterium]|nr:hypothetical protein [bacterium]
MHTALAASLAEEVPVALVFNGISHAVMMATPLHLDGATIQAFQISGVVANLDIGLLFVFAIISLSVYGIVLAGWSSNSKYPFLGGIRSSAQIISYEIAMGASVVPIFLVTQQLNLGKIVEYQVAWEDCGVSGSAWLVSVASSCGWMGGHFNRTGIVFFFCGVFSGIVCRDESPAF